jgi:CDP-glucose 4,6-dehydratase
MRPWQHVLDSLTGYLMLGERLLGGDTAAAHAWNFGPSAQECLSVEQLLCKLQAAWPNLHWRVDRDQHPHEAHVLLLDASLAQQRLGWRSIWDTERAISATAMWYRAWFERGELRTDHDLYEYAADARRQGAAWAH